MTPAKSEEILAEAGGKALLKKDVPEKYFKNSDLNDSSGILAQYVNRWIDNQILLQEAEHYLNSEEKDKSKFDRRVINVLTHL